MSNNLHSFIGTNIGRFYYAVKVRKLMEWGIGHNNPSRWFIHNRTCSLMQANDSPTELTIQIQCGILASLLEAEPGGDSMESLELSQYLNCRNSIRYGKIFGSSIQHLRLEQSPYEIKNSI